MLSLARVRLVGVGKREWDTAHAESVERSSYRRADIIDRIHADAAPSIKMVKDKQKFNHLDEIERKLRESLEAEGGSLN